MPAGAAEAGPRPTDRLEPGNAPNDNDAVLDPASALVLSGELSANAKGTSSLL